MKRLLPRFLSLRGTAAMLSRAGRAATALLAVAMLTLSAQTAKAKEVLYATVSGTEMTLQYGEPTGTSGTDYYDYTNYYWSESFRSSITSATIDASCSGYTGTKLEDLFCDFSNLKTITGLGNLGTTNVTTMESMFQRCTSLTSLDLSGLNTANVTNMADMFSTCTSLTSLDLSGLNTENVTEMYSMFQSCTNLTSLTFGGSFKTTAVTEMSSMFSRCENLTSLDLSTFNTANVKTMSSMFYKCKNLTSLNLSNFNTENLKNMYQMFYECSELTTLDLRSFNTAKVTRMSETFKDCTKLTTIWVGKDWTTAAVTVVNNTNTFNGCTSLVGGNGTTCDGSSNVGYDYARVDLGTANPGYLSAPKLYGIASGSTLTLKSDITTPSGAKAFNATYSWFGNATAMSAITSIVVDESCQTAVALTTLAHLFEDFSAATSITGLENLNTANVTDMTCLFLNCKAVTLLDLSAWDTQKVTGTNTMLAMFKNCTELKTIIVGDKWNTASSSDMFTNSKKIVGGYGATTATNPAAVIDYNNATTGETGYLTAAARTLTATADDSGSKYWATFFNSAVGYKISGGEAFAGEYNSGTQTVTLTSLGSEIPANTPVVICATSGTVNMKVDNTITAYAGINNLHGTDTETATPANSYCLAIGGSSNGELNGKAGFFAYDGTNIPARRAYLTISGGAALARGFIGFGGDDENTTGIALPEASHDGEDGEVFDLSGRRISGQPQKGIYVKNGKKFVIK